MSLFRRSGGLPKSPTYIVAPGLNALTGAANTLAIGALGKLITVTHSGVYTQLTVPPNSSVKYPVGCLLRGKQTGAARVVVVPGAGVTVDAGSRAHHAPARL